MYLQRQGARTWTTIRAAQARLAIKAPVNVIVVWLIFIVLLFLDKPPHISSGVQ